MEVQLFQEADFARYKAWYEDEKINLHLGPPPDKEWLNYILKNEKGAQYAFFEKHKMVGVMGIVFPYEAHPNYYITDIAVHPKLRKKGIGAKMLELLQGLHPLALGQSYKAFVDIKNNNAQLFFKKLGWRLIAETPDKDDLLSFTFKTK